ncbi:non-homologous end-joining DNA ligase [Nonomuraea sediminis]|uniref:non-homologous end-joining DNA ligase n=1 Tax=Nonomuraea sediminis TaxID=2835864 RepID=UPI001BDC59BB|nr:non-homologous end-joining DNA ligase [Nonomuraea sediminis]
MALPRYAPMMAQLGSLPPVADREAWAAEMKWDGVRAVLYVEGGAVTIMSRNLRDVTAAYPELRMIAGAVRRHDVVLDGEIVAWDEAGRPSFSRLQNRMHVRHPARVAELVRAVPVTYLAFDIMHLDADPVIHSSYVERRRLLEKIVEPGARWEVPVAFTGDPVAALRLADQLGLEGVVCKRLTSPYTPGRRSPYWIKIKNVKHQDVIIIGWKPGEGRRAGTLGSLLLGAHDENGRLRFIGHVGTGFTDAMLNDLRERLAPLELQDPPVDDVPRDVARGARWVRPALVGEVQYGEWTPDHRLRHPSWRGLRYDVEPISVTQPGLPKAG